MRHLKLPNIGTPSTQPKAEEPREPLTQNDANAGGPGEPGEPEETLTRESRSRGNGFAGNGFAGKLKGKKKPLDVRHPEFRAGTLTPVASAISAPTEAQIEAMKQERLCVLKALAEARSGRVKLTPPKRKAATTEDKPSNSSTTDLPNEERKDPIEVVCTDFGYVGTQMLTLMEHTLNAGDPHFDTLNGGRQHRATGERGQRLRFTSANTTMVPIPNFLLQGLAELTGTYDEGSTKEDYEYFSVSLGDLLVEAIAGYLAGKCERGSSADLRDQIKYEALARGMATSDYLFELFDEMGRGYIKYKTQED